MAVSLLSTPPTPLLCLSSLRSSNPTFLFRPSYTHRDRDITLRVASSQAVEADDETAVPAEPFDWYSQWYPVAPVCDLDKRRPHARKVMGLDVVVWWDRHEGAWKVFHDRCPHRLAPLSEGRIDSWGRLQCVYHGWCFDGKGTCKFIPQELPEGPKFHTFKKAHVASYPSIEQNKIVWFWPSTDPKYKDILEQRKPPYIPELDDHSYTSPMGIREIPYGYEVLIENLMDPAHVPYAHYGIMRTPSRDKSTFRDREGGRPLDINVLKLDKNGFTARHIYGFAKFIAPCIYYSYSDPRARNDVNTLEKSEEVLPAKLKKPRMSALLFICIPVAPGRSRLIWSMPRNFAIWMDKIVPRWVFHINQNLILDSDLHLLHVQEKKIAEVGPENWMKSCFVPTTSDALVVGFRRWLKKYANGQLHWGNNFQFSLPPTPIREQLMDRYWSHVVNCTSCSSALKALQVIEVALQATSIVCFGILAVVRQNMFSVLGRSALAFGAVICFLASRWLSHFLYRNFHYHDYDHAFK